MKVVVDQVQSARRASPGFARKFVGDEINLVQTEQWSDIETGAVEVVIPGKPGQMRGTIRLRESGGTTTETVDMEIKVGIPLVGGKIESLIADLLRKALKAENAVGRELPGALTPRADPAGPRPGRPVRRPHAGRATP